MSDELRRMPWQDDPGNNAAFTSTGGGKSGQDDAGEVVADPWSGVSPVVMIVDDTRFSLRLLSGILSERGYEVIAVSRSTEALSSAKETKPDLILLDIMMPEMDGFDTCRVLKSDEQTTDVPVIFISSLNETFDKVKAFSLGGVDYVSKPFQAEEVLARVKTHLTLRFMQARLREQNSTLQREIAERRRAQEKLEVKNGQLAQANEKLASAKGRLEEVNKELREALDEVRKLSGLLPICASCKKIRDDKGYWRQLETYIRDHSEADFSHSICPECARVLYPDLNTSGLE